MRQLDELQTYKKLMVIGLRTHGLTFDEISALTKVPKPTVGLWIRKTIESHPRKYKNLVFKPGPRTKN